MGYKTIAAAVAVAVTAIVDDSSSYEKDEISASGCIHKSPKCFAHSFVWLTYTATSLQINNFQKAIMFHLYNASHAVMTLNTLIG